MHVFEMERTIHICPTLYNIYYRIIRSVSTMLSQCEYSAIYMCNHTPFQSRSPEFIHVRYYKYSTDQKYFRVSKLLFEMQDSFTFNT